MFRQARIKTHLIFADADKAKIKVEPAKIFLGDPKVTCRYSVISTKNDAPLNCWLGVTAKDNGCNSLIIPKDLLLALGILTLEQYDDIQGMARSIAAIVRDELLQKGIVLWGINLRFGLHSNGKVMLIGRISPSSLHVNKDGQKLSFLKIAELFFANS